VRVGAYAIAELPRIVRALKGSTTLRAANQAFSSGVIGFTLGPSIKRSYQLIGALEAGRAQAARLAGIYSYRALPARRRSHSAAWAASELERLAWQGPGVGGLGCAGSCGPGAFGSGGWASRPDWPTLKSVVKALRDKQQQNGARLCLRRAKLPLAGGGVLAGVLRIAFQE